MSSSNKNEVRDDLGKPEDAKSNVKKANVKYPGLPYTLFVKPATNDTDSCNPWFECILCAPNEKMIPKEMSSHLKSFSHVWNVLILERPASNQFEEGDETKVQEISEFLRVGKVKDEVMVAANLTNVYIKRQEILDHLNDIKSHCTGGKINSPKLSNENENILQKTSFSEAVDKTNSGVLSNENSHQKSEPQDSSDDFSLNQKFHGQFSLLEFTYASETDVSEEKKIDDSLTDDHLEELNEYSVFQKGSKAVLYFMNLFEVIDKQNKETLEFNDSHSFYNPLKGSYLGLIPSYTGQHLMKEEKDFLKTSLNYISLYHNVLIYEDKYILPKMHLNDIINCYHEKLHHIEAETLFYIINKEFYVMIPFEIDTIQSVIKNCATCKNIPEHLQKVYSQIVIEAYNSWPNRRDCKKIMLDDLICSMSLRKPKKIIIIGDERENYLKAMTFPEGVSVKICPGLKFENAYDFISCDPSFNEGVLYVMLAGHLSALTFEIDPQCIAMNCPNKCSYPNLIKTQEDELFPYLIHNCRNLLQAVLLNSCNDSIIFAHMVPCDLKTMSTKLMESHACSNHSNSTHPTIGKWGIKALHIMSAVFNEYNSIVDSWSQLLGYPFWDMSTHFFDGGFLMKRKSCPTFHPENMYDGINFSPRIVEHRINDIQNFCNKTLQQMQKDEISSKLPSNILSIINPICLGKNKIAKFDKIIILCEPEHRAALEPFSSNQVLVTDVDISPGSIDNLVRTFNLREFRSLWIFTSSIKPVANRENYGPCRNCQFILPIVMAKGGFDPNSDQNMINNILNGVKEIVKCTENIVGSNCVAVVLPLIPVLVANDATISHNKLHELSSVHKHLLVINNDSLSKLLPLNNKLAVESLSLAIELFKKKGLYPVALSKYCPRWKHIFRSIGTKQSHISDLPIYYEQLVRDVIYSALTGYPTIGASLPAVIQRKYPPKFNFKHLICRKSYHFQKIIFVSNKSFSISSQGIDVPYIQKVVLPLSSSEEFVQEQIDKMNNCESVWIYLLGPELIADRQTFNNCQLCIDKAIPSYYRLKNENPNNSLYYGMDTFKMVKSCVMRAQQLAMTIQKNIKDSNVVILPMCQTTAVLTELDNVHDMLHKYPQKLHIQEFLIGEESNWNNAFCALEFFYPFLVECVNLPFSYCNIFMSMYNKSVKSPFIITSLPSENENLIQICQCEWATVVNKFCATLLTIKKGGYNSCLGIYPEEVCYSQLKTLIDNSTKNNTEGVPSINHGDNPILSNKNISEQSAELGQLDLVAGGLPPMMAGRGGPSPMMAGRGGPSQMMAGRGGPPAMMAGRGGPPPMMVGGGGPPPMMVGGGGPPPMMVGGGGPPPMMSARGGPPPMMIGGRGPPPMMAGWGGPPPMMAGRGGPPPMMGGRGGTLQMMGLEMPNNFPHQRNLDSQISGLPQNNFGPPQNISGSVHGMNQMGLGNMMYTGLSPHINQGPPPMSSMPNLHGGTGPSMSQGQSISGLPPKIEQATSQPHYMPGFTAPEVHQHPPEVNPMIQNVGGSINTTVPPPFMSSYPIKKVFPPSKAIIAAKPIKYDGKTGNMIKTEVPPASNNATEFRVLVGKIPISLTDCYLSSMLVLIGNFLSFDRPKVENASYGVAKFLSEEAAERAVRILDNFPIMGGIIEVRLLYYTEKEKPKKYGVSVQNQDVVTRKAINDRIKFLLKDFKGIGNEGNNVVLKQEIQKASIPLGANVKKSPIIISLKTKELNKKEELEDISNSDDEVPSPKSTTKQEEKRYPEKFTMHKFPHFRGRGGRRGGRRDFYHVYTHHQPHSRSLSRSRSRSRSKSYTSSSSSSPDRKERGRKYDNYDKRRGYSGRSRASHYQFHNRLPRAPPTSRPWSPSGSDRQNRKVFSPPKVLPEVKIYNYSRIFKCEFLDDLVLACGSHTRCKRRGTFFLVNFYSMKRAVMVAEHLNNKRIVDRTLKVEVLGKTKGVKEKIGMVENAAVGREIEKVYEEHKLSLITTLQGDILKDPDIFTFHIFPCEVINCRAYDCHYYHGLSDKRRDYLKYKYTEKMCPHIQGGKPCPQEDWCIHCHSQVERLYHPKSYKSNVCLDWYEEEKCANQLFCPKAHPLSNDSFFTEAWKDVFVAGLDQGFFYFSGALKMFYKVVDSEGGVPIIFLSPLVDICQLLLKIVKPISRIHRLKTCVITEDDLDPGGADVILSTPAALAALIKGKGSAPLGGVCVLVLDDITTLINSPVHATHLHTIIDAIYLEVKDKDAICKVAISETCHPTEIQDANSVLKTKFHLFNPYSIDQAMPPSVSQTKSKMESPTVLSDSDEGKRLSESLKARGTAKQTKRRYSTSSSSSSSSSNKSFSPPSKSKRRKRHSDSSSEDFEPTEKLTLQETEKIKMLEDEANIDIDESFNVYLEVPEMHPEYESRYDKFLKSYKKKYGSSDESEHLERMWQKYWKMCIKNLKFVDLKRKKEEILKQITTEKKLHLTSSSKKVLDSSCFSENVLFLEKISESIKGVGNSLHSLMNALTLYGINSPKSINLLSKEDSINIMEAASNQLSEMAEEEGNEKRKSQYSLALRCIIELIKHAKSLIAGSSKSVETAEKSSTSGNPAVRFDIDVFARQTVGQDDSWIYATLEKSLEYAYGCKPAVDKQNKMFENIKKLHTALMSAISTSNVPVVADIQSQTQRPSSKPLTIPLTPLIPRTTSSRIPTEEHKRRHGNFSKM